MPPLLVTTLQPQTATDFTGFHLGLNRPIMIRFVSDDAGQITQLLVLAPGREVTAMKIGKGD